MNDLEAHLVEETIFGDLTFNGTNCVLPATNCFNIIEITPSSSLDGLFDELDQAIDAEDVGSFVEEYGTYIAEMFPDLTAVQREYVLNEIWTIDLYSNTSNGVRYYKFGTDPVNGNYSLVTQIAYE